MNLTSLNQAGNHDDWKTPVFPDHLPEVVHRLFFGSLSGNKLHFIRHILKKTAMSSLGFNFQRSWQRAKNLNINDEKQDWER